MTRITRTMPGAANEHDAHRALSEDALKRAEFERDCYRVLGAREKARATVIQLASHQKMVPAEATVQAARELRTEAALAETAHKHRLLYLLAYKPLPQHAADREVQIGCTSACEWGQPCSCSYSASSGPRQPRRSLPTQPRLSLWRRIVLALQSLRAGFRRAR